MKSVQLIYVTLAALTLLSTNLFADSSHQFSVGLNTSDVEYEYQGESKVHSFGATAYFESVKKSSSLPYARTAFYNRTGSISLSASKEEHKDLNRVSSDRILNSIEAKSYSAQAFLAQKELPVWGVLEYTYLDRATYKFNAGSTDTSDADSVKSIVIGGFIGSDLSIYGSFSKKMIQNTALAFKNYLI